ncbi:MAG: hypothetical protein E7034_01170 [Akkermansiaceae bacterium]|nr:hypothetical protein [Akkermansiaceae bacterium]
MKKAQETLLLAARNTDTQTVLKLLGLGTPPNYRNHIFPVHAAAIVGNPVILEALLKAGANPNARSMMGHTVLQYAMTRGHSLRKVLKMVGLLLQYGAVADTHGNFSHHSEMAYELKSQKLMDLLGFSMEECAERDRQEREEKARKRELWRAQLRARKLNASAQSEEA